jgi:hypothetical protein
MARERLAGGYDFLSLLARLMETDVDPLARPAAPTRHCAATSPG